MNALEQTLLLGTSALILVTTLVIFVWRFVQMQRRDRRDRDD